MKVCLTSGELTIAAMVGVYRRVRALRDGRRDRYGAPIDRRWDRDIEGAAGEYVIAKAIGRFWDPAIGQTPAGDVGPFGVRTCGQDGDCLIVRDDDDDDRTLILVTGVAPAFVIRGWLRARDGKRQAYRDDKQNGRPPAYFVPQSALCPGLPEVSRYD